jgi:hypothetical protein
MLRFNLYGGETFESLTYNELLALAEECGMLYARAEFSGSEGCYVEVARWNNKAGQWQRFAFEKVFDEYADDGRFGDVRVATCYERADWIARKLNHAGGVGPGVRLIHSMPSYKAVKKPVAQPAKLDMVDFAAKLCGF